MTTMQCRVFKAGDTLEASCTLPENTHQMLECLLLIVQEVARQTKVTPYQLLSDLAAMDQGRVKW